MGKGKVKLSPGRRARARTRGSRAKIEASKKAATGEPRGGTGALEPHPIATAFPPMTEAEFEDLVADIRQHGQREPVVLFEGKVLDGVHRDGACVKLGIATWKHTFEGTTAEAIAYA